ncbi:glycosyltransferase family 4 protein [Streptomyces erythrochromogenes]|uniref:Glycosyltransferase family 4 protein n=1 Tax=Streptomyces erythrochromogenes TaxID=285574 RepID=A0ABZ1Q725_9ACTN|nr:glycosyltransferase family 4 protein [Streptomyces erythrochromogenes]MCX5582596.1 glycosyltransferase family 4 protein [Streptomyces erythrochromogenes]
MRTVLQITPYYPPHLGGLERVVLHLSRCLAQRHDVRVVTTALGSGGAPRRAQEDGVTVRRHRATEFAHTAIAPGLLGSLLAAPRGAVLHAHCAHALLPETVALAARLRRQPFVLHFHLDVDASGRLGGLLPAYKKHVFGRVARAAAAVIVLTEQQARFVEEAYRVPPARVHVVPNGVGPEFFRAAPAPATVPVGTTTATRRPLRLLYVGRLSAQKNIARLLDAINLAESPLRLRIVGGGELDADLRARAAGLGLGERVEFTGPLYDGDLLAAYADADVFVLPSDREGMPLAALEAMAAALPVLATDVPGNAELLRGVGLLAAPDPASLAAAVDRLAADPGLRGRLAGRSAERARRHTWEEVTRQVELVYRKAGI